MGTYLINLHNTSIEVNGHAYSNLEASQLEIMPGIIQPTPMEEEKLIHDLNIQNTRRIRTVDATTIVNLYYSNMYSNSSSNIFPPRK